MNRQPNTEESANSGLVPQLGMMVRALWAAPVRNTLFLLSGALFLVVAATAYGQIRLNSWNQPFYDALSRRDFAQFLMQLGVFGLIAASTVDPQRGAALAWRDIETQAAGGSGA